mmetsp:Transcript_4356/g.8714  ORF Transcript_4356/g.8714 Transcript_4356/m.8714 type:complete len:283 (-) Transcript_4356:55-903(-)
MKYCKEWAVKSELPSDHFLIVYLVVLITASSVFAAAIKTDGCSHRRDVSKILQDAGLAVHKVAKTAWEIDRKLFKLTGLGVPMVHQLLLSSGISNSTCIGLIWTFTLSFTAFDFMRLHVPVVRRILDYVFKGVLRKDEQDRLSAASYFLLGCALAIHIFAPVVAMTSIIFLVMGVLCSTLITRAFGTSVVGKGSGAESRLKSLEGSAAMFTVCFALGCSIFHRAYLREYAVFWAALAATLVELWEPLGVSYNVGIPVITSMALTIGFERTLSCGSSIVVEGR